MTVEREFISAECLMVPCKDYGLTFTSKKQAKEHTAETQHSVIIREQVVTIWRH